MAPEGAGSVGSPPLGAKKSPERLYSFLTTATAIDGPPSSREPGCY